MIGANIIWLLRKNLARENGFKGLYIMVTNSIKEYGQAIDGILRYEPGYTLHNELNRKDGTRNRKPEIYNYDMIWRNILVRRKSGGAHVFLGAFTDYDDSPRRGKEGCIVLGGTPRKFGFYLRLLLLKSKNRKYGRYIFITAWNEWGEGAYLEPDEENRYAYLKACRWAMNAKRTVI